MRRGLLGLAVLLASPFFVFGQVDIPVNSRAFYVDLARGAAWGSSGLSGTNNQWIYSPVVPDEGTCVAIWNNNPTSSHTFKAAAYATLDQTINRYQNLIGTNLASRWVQLAVFGPGGTSYSQSGVSASTITVSPSSSIVLYYRTGGAARIAFQISNSSTQTGTPDTADVLMSRGIDSGVCGNTMVEPQTSANCSNSATVTLPGTGMTSLVGAVSGQAIHVCSIVLNNAAGVAPTVTFYSNTTAISGAIPLSAGQLETIETSYGQLFQTTAGQALQAQQTGTNLIITVSYALY